MGVWNLANCKLKTNHIGHQGYLNTVAVSPDGSLCASGGKDKQTMLWDLNEGKHLYTWTAGMSSTPSASAPTATGSAPPPDPPSRSGIWKERPSWTRFALRCSIRAPALSPHSASPWPGPRMDRLCSLDIQTM